MNCPSCHADVSIAAPGDGVLPKCPRCGGSVLPPEAEAELEGFRARLAKFGLGGDHLTRSAASNGEL
jgi:Zn-finger nucleic acid-binding protein